MGNWLHMTEDSVPNSVASGKLLSPTECQFSYSINIYWAFTMCHTLLGTVDTAVDETD